MNPRTCRTIALSVGVIVAVWALSSKQQAGRTTTRAANDDGHHGGSGGGAANSPFAPPWRHLGATCAIQRRGLEHTKTAIAVAACNGTDHMNQGGRVQLERAATLAASIRTSRASSGADAGVVLVLLLSGFDDRSTSVAGFDRHVFVDRELRFATKLPPRSSSPYRDTVWPEDQPSSRSVQYLRKL